MTRHTIATLGRHQVAATIAAAVDYAVMIALVSGFGWSPAAGTAVGAAFGGVTNFTLGRHWAFDGRAGNPRHQAMRYALVSGTSLGLNTLGEFVLAELVGLHYVLARVMVSITVSLAWNYPMQRFFVFERKRVGEVARCRAGGS